MINYRLIKQYDFDIVWNKYKYCLQNLMRHFGKVDKNQVPHSDYPITKKVFKKKSVSKKNT